MTKEIPEHCQHWLIYGKVQGVGYRLHMQQAARLLNLKGWCRNLNTLGPDQSVEAVIGGPAGQIQKLYEWALHGPPEALVLRIERTAQDKQGKYARMAIDPFPFEIRR